MTDPMGEIMAADEQVDVLPEIGVMDLLVRAKLMRAVMDHYSGTPTGWESEGYRDAENALMNHSQDGVRVWVTSEHALSGWLHEAAANNRAEDWTVAAFEGMTPDEWERDRAIHASRGWLKRHLSGSLGMPDDRVIRENLKNYDGDA